VNELVEAKHQLQLRRVLARWSRYDLIAIDEVGYVPMADVGAEFLFQVIAERAEKTAVILTTNLPFSEWTQVIPNARLCKALIDRITDRAHIIETGTESFRFRRTLERRKKRIAMIRADTCWQVGYPRINRHQATLTLSGLCTGGHGPIAPQ
jgi:DNA replication protein DnaC